MDLKKFIRRKPNIALIGVAACLLCACKKDAAVSFSADEVVTDVTQAYLYHYTIFREAEYAWAMVDLHQYPAEPVVEERNGARRSISYTEPAEGSKPKAVVEYQAWTWGNAILTGSIIIDLPGRDLYREAGKPATVSLSGFAINNQSITGYGTMTYSGGDNGDRYSYSVNNAPIYSSDGQQILISSSLSGGSFIRVAGSDTDAQEDDLWTCTGSMSGNSRNNVKIKYTNTVVSALEFDWGCSAKAVGGLCRLTVNQLPIAYEYGGSCSAPIMIVSITDNKK